MHRTTLFGVVASRGPLILIAPYPRVSWAMKQVAGVPVWAWLVLGLNIALAIALWLRERFGRRANNPWLEILAGLTALILLLLFGAHC